MYKVDKVALGGIVSVNSFQKDVNPLHLNDIKKSIDRIGCPAILLHRKVRGIHCIIFVVMVGESYEVYYGRSNKSYIGENANHVLKLNEGEGDLISELDAVMKELVISCAGPVSVSHLPLQNPLKVYGGSLYGVVSNFLKVVSR